jgi:carbamoyltransferase
MRALGIHSLTHDCGTAMCVDGKIKYAVEEERFSRIKHHPGIEVEGKPPKKSLEWTLEQEGIELNDVDKIVHVGWKGDSFMKLDIIRQRFRDYAKSLDPELKKTIFVDHHLAHAASAYYASGFKDALVLSIDGAGDWQSTSLYVANGEKMEKVDEYFLDQSLGFMYSRAASALGLGGFGTGEGKLIALASYGSPINDFPEFLTHLEGRYKLDPNYKKHFKSFKNDGVSFSQEHKDFAATIQYNLEDSVKYIVKNMHRKFGGSNLVIGGGVGLNCRMNGKLAELPWVDNMFVQPAANDAGLCIGAAYLGAIELGDKPEEFDNAYLGPGISENEVEKYVRDNGLRAEKVENIAELAADLIYDGESLAWMQGKLEFGPRALGHRSLLGDPRNLEVRDKLNAIKQRENWRPIAPSVLQDSHYFNASHGSEYMTHAIDMYNSAKQEIPGAVHVDQTARVQIVSDKSDRYHQLISAFNNKTNVPAVLNTSLNSRGEPLCNSISEGVKFFYTTPTENLIIDKWWFKK